MESSLTESNGRNRIICWFSCGVTSAVAAKLTVDEYGADRVDVVYTDPGSEPADNLRFLKDCEVWIGKPIEIIRSTKYRDTWDVYEKTRWLVGPGGARCTAELKIVPRRIYTKGREDDPQIFGFDTSENVRVERFRENNPEIDLRTPLITQGMSKAQCAEMVMRAGIEIPDSYRMGFAHANCPACPKAGMGHWNKVRRVLPLEFERMAKLERTLDVAICKSYAGDNERKRVFLDELDPDAGMDKPEESWECGLLCGVQDELF